MNKIIIIIPIILIVIGLTWKFIIDNKKQNYYKNMKENIQEDIKKYISISHPYCSVGSAEYVIDNEILIVQAGIDKEKFLDIDGESYCKVRINVRCVAENEHEWATNIKCKDYEYNGMFEKK